MGILLEEIFELFGDHVSFDICEYSSSELLDVYDGKNSVDPRFNECEVKRIFPNWNQKTIEVYIEV